MNYVKDAFVLCKLKKKTRSLRGVAVDASPAVIDLSPTIIADPMLNHPQVLYITWEQFFHIYKLLVYVFKVGKSDLN